jgi:hypothetical protein
MDLQQLAYLVSRCLPNKNMRFSETFWVSIDQEVVQKMRQINMEDMSDEKLV